MAPSLKFEVVSARIVGDENSKKYVAYMVVIKLNGEDPHPAIIERRYTDFLCLYDSLKKDFPEALYQVNFPRKVLIGNFSPEMISARSFSFERILSYISSHESLKDDPAVISFLHDKEMLHAHSLIERELYEAAKPVLENSFWLLSKVCTDRAPLLLRCLCLSVAISAKSKDSSAMNLASIAIQRYQAVSDVDLLKYYVPLLHTAKEVCSQSGQDYVSINRHLDELKRKGINIKPTQSLLQVVMEDVGQLHNNQ